jgi:hypothetical protein
MAGKKDKKAAKVEPKKEEKVEPKVEKEVKSAKETPRRKFHKFYREVYLVEDPIVPDEPHHADKHGILGYENNSGGTELHTNKDGITVPVEVVGLCKDCTKDRDSAQKAYEKWIA